MKINENFRENLLVGYLDLLSQKDNKEEFLKYYPLVEQHMSTLVSNSTDTEQLAKVGCIVSYRKKCMEIEVAK